ncbi:MAG: 4Fe-4S binding protein [Actinobacteria bacterium]|nr:4Fe-4S binding protein [Actinomycetota bacterium]
MVSEGTTIQKRQRIRKTLLLISLLLLPVTMFYFSPYLIVWGGSQGIVVGSFLMFSAMFLSSLFIGRLWCGWLCPTGGVQEYSTKIRDKRARGGKCNWIKFFLWVPWLAITVLAFIDAGGIHKVDPFWNIDYGITVATPQNIVSVLALILLLIFMVLTTGRRGFCHYLCWMSPFMILGRKLGNAARLPGLRLTADVDKCRKCMKCIEVCPMSLDVNSMVQIGKMENSECNLCGECIDSCPEHVIDYRFCRIPKS